MSVFDSLSVFLSVSKGYESRVKECYGETGNPCPEYQPKIKTPNKYCFGFQTKFSIFLRNYRDCMVEDRYKARKRYTVTESLDLIASVK